MSLIDKMMDVCVIMNKTKVSDGQGGYTTTWTEGAEILVAIVNDTSISSRIAESQGVTSTYTLTTHKDVILEYHDVIKRLSDNKTFRVTSDGNDKLSPDFSTINMTQVTAERWALT